MRFTTFLVLALFFAGCSSNKVDPPAADPTIYTAPCAINEIFWIDNQSVFLYTTCGANMYIVNTVTKQERSWNTTNFLVQRMHYTKDIPGKIFFTSLTKTPGGGFDMPIKLYALQLSNLSTQLIADNLTEIPTGGNYILGSKKMAIRHQLGASTILVDLENSSSQTLNITGDVQAFSPDDSKLLFYNNYSSPLANTFTYDLNCSCSTPITLSGTGRAIWRTQGILSYATGPWNMDIQNLQTGTIIKSFPEYIMGPWIGLKSQKLLVYLKSPTWATDQDAILMSYDLMTAQTKDLAHSKFFLGSPTISGILTAAESQDGTKVAYTVDGSRLRVASF